MFDSMMKPPPVFDDPEAGFEAAGVDMAGEPEEMAPAEQEMSMEDMIFEHFLDQLVMNKQNSLNYQNKVKEENLAGLKEADSLRRKLGG